MNVYLVYIVVIATQAVLIHKGHIDVYVKMVTKTLIAKVRFLIVDKPENWKIFLDVNIEQIKLV